MNTYKNIYSFLAVIVLFNVSVFGQSELIQLVDFNSPTSVTELGGFIDECDLPNTPQNDGIFGVSNGQFIISDSEGTCCPNSQSQGLNNNFALFLIPPILFSYCDVTISMDHFANGSNFDCSVDPCSSFTGADAFSIQVDAGNGFQFIGSYCGASVDQGNFTLNLGDIEMGTALTFQITGGAPSENSFYSIDNIRLEGIPRSLIPAEISSQSDEICEGTDPLILSAQPADGINYQWIGPNGSITGNTSVVTVTTMVTPADEGLYTVTITEAGGCTSTDEVMIDIQTIEEKDIATKFPFIANSYCENVTDLPLPTSSALDNRSGTWNVSTPLDLTGRQDSTELIFTYDDNTGSETLYLRIDTIPNMGNNLTSMTVCVTDENPVLNLVDLFDLNINNIQDAFAFGSGFIPTELNQIDVSTIANNVPHTVNFISNPNGACDSESSGQIFIDFNRIDVGRDTTIQVCEGDFITGDFINIHNLISSTNPAGQWTDLSNSGIALPQNPVDEVSFTDLDAGTYQYQFDIDASNLCGDPLESTSILTVEIVTEVGVEITTESIMVACGNPDNDIELNFSDDQGSFVINIQLDGDDGSIPLGPITLSDGSHFLSIDTTSGPNSVIGNTIFLNPTESESYEVSVTDVSLAGGQASCGSSNIGPLTTDIEFQEGELIPIGSQSLCQGEVFTFRNFIFTTSIDTQVVISGAPCDTLFEIILDFIPSFIESTTIDICNSDGTFRNFAINQDTMITTSSTTGGCDTIWEVSRILTPRPDSIHPVNELCDNDSEIIEGVLYDTTNTSGSYNILSDEGCMQTVVVDIDFEAGVFVDFDPDPLCGGTEITIAGLDSIHTFNEDNIEGEVLLGFSGTGCDSILFVSLEFIETVQDTIPVSLCPGQTMTVRGIQVDENTQLSETYVVGPNSCDSVLRFDVTVESLEMANVTIDPCVDGNTFRGIIINQDTTIDVSAADGGCDTSYSIVLMPSDISATFTSSNSCEGENSGQIRIRDITGQGPFTINAGTAFSGSTNDNMLDILNLEQGLYEITIMDASGCTFVNDIAVDNFNFSINIESTQNPDRSVNLNVTSNNATIILSPIWSPAEGLSCDDCLNPLASPMDTTIYTVTAFDDNGCMATAMVTINGDAVILPPVDSSKTQMPNVITPNSGNINSVFHLQQLDDGGLYNMQIFNRYGEVVYEVNNAVPGDVSTGWRGTYNGTPLKPGVFVYKIYHTNINNEEELIMGDILLLK